MPTAAVHPPPPPEPATVTMASSSGQKQQQQQQQPSLRRAVYIHVSDLTAAYNIDHARLEQELTRVKTAREGPAAAQAARLGVPSELDTTFSSQKRLQPPRGGYNLCCLVGKVEVVVDKSRVDGSRVRLAEVEVGDETGTVSLRARDEQIDTLKEVSERSGAVVLRNCTLELYQGKHIRLAITKWGKLSAYPDQVASTPPPPSKMNHDRNFSLIDLSLVASEMVAFSEPPFRASGEHNHQEGQPGGVSGNTQQPQKSYPSGQQQQGRHRGRRQSRQAKSSNTSGSGAGVVPIHYVEPTGPLRYAPHPSGRGLHGGYSPGGYGEGIDNSQQVPYSYPTHRQQDTSTHHRRQHHQQQILFQQQFEMQQHQMQQLYQQQHQQHGQQQQHQQHGQQQHQRQHSQHHQQHQHGQQQSQQQQPPQQERQQRLQQQQHHHQERQPPPPMQTTTQTASMSSQVLGGIPTAASFDATFSGGSEVVPQLLGSNHFLMPMHGTRGGSSQQQQQQQQPQRQPQHQHQQQPQHQQQQQPQHRHQQQQQPQQQHQHQHQQQPQQQYQPQQQHQHQHQHQHKQQQHGYQGGHSSASPARLGGRGRSESPLSPKMNPKAATFDPAQGRGSSR